MRSPTVWDLVGARFSAAPTEARTGRTAWEWCGARLTFHESSEVSGLKEREMKRLKTSTPSAVFVVDGRDPKAGNASHQYIIDYRGDEEPEGENVGIDFQRGPRSAGVNGILDDDLLAIIQDRYEGFQSGPFACAENAEALQHIIAAREAIARRVQDREARGVLGKNEK